MSKRKHAIEAHFQQGLRLHGAGRLDDAAQVYQQILSGAPNHAGSLHMLGVAALQSGQPQAALELFSQAIALKPSDADFHVNRAGALLALGQPEAAIAASREALRLKRNSAPANLVLGHALSDAGRPKDAVLAYQEALRLDPKLHDARAGLGLALRESNRLQDAAACLRGALQSTPDDLAVWGNLAGLLKDLGHLNEAEGIYRDILRAHPDDARAHYDLGILLLLAGRYPEGWSEYEWRFRAHPGLAPDYSIPLWHGEPLAGRTLLVHFEQGYGDMIQFARYLPRLPSDGRVVLQMFAPLAPLFSGCTGVSVIVPSGQAPPTCDVRCPMMSLPFALGLAQEADIPADVPYLQVDPARAARWRRRVEALDGLRVGLVWAGNPAQLRMDMRRSVALQQLAPIADVPGVSLISLQKGEAATAVSGPPMQRLHDWTSELTDFAETAALIQQLDLVIGVDTAVVHLAGALGRPAWLLNRYDTCWRWQLGRDDSPWYPTLRQFRQAAPGEWGPVIENVAKSLAERAASP